MIGGGEKVDTRGYVYIWVSFEYVWGDGGGISLVPSERRPRRLRLLLPPARRACGAASSE